MFLIAKGYRILARRFKTPFGEIDIVARRRGILVFVEVKARASADDAVENVTPTPAPPPTSSPWPEPVETDGVQLLVGKNRTTGLRFQSLTIPQGATIYSAHLKLHCYGGGANSISLNYTAEDAGSASQFQAVARNISDRWPLPSAAIADVPAAWPGGTFVRSPELKDLVQAVVDRGDWQSGNAIVFFIEDNGSTQQRGVTAYDDPAVVDGVVYDGTGGRGYYPWFWHSAKLYVAYRKEGGPTTPTTTPLPTIPSTPKGGGGCAVSPGGAHGWMAVAGILAPYLLFLTFLGLRRTARARARLFFALRSEAGLRRAGDGTEP